MHVRPRANLAQWRSHLLARLRRQIEVTADPVLDSEPTLGGVTDPNTGETSPVFASTAQLALFCLSGASDWLSLQDCISMNDRSIQLGAVVP